MKPRPIPYPPRVETLHATSLQRSRRAITQGRTGLALLLACSAVLAADPTPPRQIWDYADQLQLRAEQRAELDQLRAAFEESRAALRSAADTNLPPDRLLRASLDHQVRVKVANQRIAALLDPAQQAAYETLRRAGAPAREEDDAEKAATAAPDLPARLPPRPARTTEEYRAQAIALRSAYARSPAAWPAPTLDDTVKPHYVELGLMPPMPYPASNPYHPAKAALGKQLFFDPRLSGSGQMSCASCHDPDRAWGDGRTVSFGHARKELPRNAPTVLNAGHLPLLFWDGRTASLEEQAAAVLRNEDEMRSSEKLLQERLGAVPGYTAAFAKVFGDGSITFLRAAQAIATFERTVTSRSNPFDTFLRGDTNALSDAAVRGLHLFRTDARCANCHHGPALTDGRFHNEGLTYYGRKFQDLGRYEISREPADVGRFKTPTLRNIARTAPYMHNGLFELDGVLNMYNAGMPSPRPRPGQETDPLFPVKSPHLQPLGLNSNDLADLRAFLESLTESKQRVRPGQGAE